MRIMLLLIAASVPLFLRGGAPYTLTYRGLMINNSKTNARKVFENISVDDYAVRAAANASYSKYKGNYTYLHGAGRFDFMPIAERRYESDGKKRVKTILQAARKYDGKYTTYQFDVILEQRDADVYAWLSGVYVAAGTHLYGRDMESLFDGKTVVKGSAGYDLEDAGGGFEKGYGVDFIALRRLGGLSETTETASPIEGDIEVPSDTEYIATGASAIVQSPGTYSGNLRVDGVMTIRNPHEKTYSGAVSGDGDIVYEASQMRTDSALDVECGKDVFLNDKWKTVSKDRLLSSLTNVTAILCGSRTGGDKDPAAYSHWRNNGAYAALQIYNKVSSSYQTGCLLRLRQMGRDIQACIASYSFNSPWANGFSESSYQYGDIDFEKMSSECQGMTIPEQRNEDGSYTDRGQVGLHSLKLFFAEGALTHVAVVEGRSSMSTGSVVRVSGGDKSPMMVQFSAGSIPSSGQLVVGRGGHAVLSGSLETGRLVVENGGFLYQGASMCIPAASTYGVCLNGGTFVVGYWSGRTSVKENYDDAGLYLNYMHFENGARLLGAAPRVGYGMNPRWYVTGTAPSVCATGMSLFPAKDAAPSAIVMEVEDVTGNAEADFRITNPIRLFYPVGEADFEAYKSAYIRKEGPGTVSMEAAYTPYQPTVIAGGTWRFSHSKSASASTDFKLEGGDLEIADGIALTMGEVIPGVASTITLGDGASVSIKVPAADWPENGSVNFVVSDIASRSPIRFGESAVLSSAHLASIRVNGKPVAQNSAGYLRPVAFRVIVR